MKLCLLGGLAWIKSLFVVLIYTSACISLCWYVFFPRIKVLTCIWMSQLRYLRVGWFSMLMKGEKKYGFKLFQLTCI